MGVAIIVKESIIDKSNTNALNKKNKKNIFKDMVKSNTELDVQRIYEEALEEYFKVKIEHPFSCDGYLECMLENEDGKSTKLMLITEYKYDKNFMSNLDKSKVLVQVLYYLKKFENSGRDLPNVILVGDKDEVFVMHSNDIKTYLDWNIDWDIAPSNAADKNMDLVLHIKNNEDINPFVYEINEDFKFKTVCEDIKHLTFDIKNQIRITDSNMSKVFDYFCNNVLKDKKKLQANQIVHIFIDLMLHPKDAYIHPKKKNILVLSNKTEVSVNRSNYDAFFNHYTRDNYTTEQKERFTEVSDRLIEDTERRRKGEFYTPTIWANEAHKMISEQFGYDWKEDYVVWDCCWGTGNLTRDYKFKELYCSTLNEVDLDTGKKYNVPGTIYNKYGSKFQYDFLNDDVDFFEELKVIKAFNGKLEESDFKGSKLYEVAPKLISSLLEGKKLMFFINPPYGTSGEMSSAVSGKAKKSGIAINKVNTLMKNNKMGIGSQQLYAQFIYRILNIKSLFDNNIDLALYTSSALLNGLQFETLRALMVENNLGFKKGTLFKASDFADVKENWSILISIWNCNGNLGFINNVDVKELNDNDIVQIAKKDLYFVQKNKSFPSKCKSILKSYTLCDAPQLKNAINLKETGVGKWCNGALGYLFNAASNNVEHNNQFLCLTSSCFANGHGWTIVNENIIDTLSYFTAKRLITGQYATWINGKDEYMIPNTNHKLYKQWENDCIVYSLFNTSSQQSSLRQIDYKGINWDIKNEFFFMSVDDMKALSNEYFNDYVYQDIKQCGEERYIYKLLQDIKLSEDAKAVLDKAIELNKLSFKYREDFNEEHPEYHINTWDASWYQIKAILKEYMPNELKEFNEMYKSLGDRMRPLVYELGFLKE